MRVVSLPTALFVALYAACTTATPLPPNGAAIIPPNFILAPLYTPPAPPAVSAAGLTTEAHLVKDSYLIVLKDDLELQHIQEHHEHVRALHAADARLRQLKAEVAGAVHHLEDALEGVVHRFHLGKSKQNGMKGYSGKFSESTIDAIRAMPHVKYVERDSLVWASDIERGAPWGLARISHRAPLGFSTYGKYEYDGRGGEGVDAYVIDTGVNVKHVEFEGRAKWGKTIPRGDVDEDANGHGSHCAGTIASAKYGVAKLANIIAVKVLGSNGSGTMSDVVAGVAWAADAAEAALQLKAAGKNPKHKGSVANMSLGGGKSQALDDAVNEAVKGGLHFAVAAGNDNRDACAYSPASAELAITVGASTNLDERAYFSNHGKCVDVFAPGLNILSTWNGYDTATNVISGTSMASPHVAGLAAYFVSLYGTASFNPATEEFTEEAYAQITGESSYARGGVQKIFGKLLEQFGSNNAFAPVPKDPKPLSPAALKKAIEKIATKNAITGALPAGTPNLLIFNNFTSSAIQEVLVEAEAAHGCHH